MAEAHHILVDGIVEHLLEQHVDSVVVVRPVAQLADVHTGAQTDMFAPVEGLDIIFYILGAPALSGGVEVQFLSHGGGISLSRCHFLVFYILAEFVHNGQNSYKDTKF